MPTSQVVGWQCFNICIAHLRYLSSTIADYDCGAQASDSSCLASPQMPEVPTLSSYKRTVACNPALQSLAGARRVLLLQGPLGNAAQLSLSGFFLTGYWVLVIRTSRGYRLWDLRGGSTKRRMFFLMAASLVGMAPGVCDPELHSHSSTM